MKFAATALAAVLATSTAAFAQTSTGVDAVDPNTVEVTFVTPETADFVASSLIGSNVHNVQDENIGTIEDLIIGEGQELDGIVVSVGGFLGLGGRYVVVSPDSVTLALEGTGDDAEWRVVMNSTREQLEQAPEFEYEGRWDR